MIINNMINNYDIELTKHEKEEILNYKDIYYIGKYEYKIHNGILSKDDRYILKVNKLKL